MCVDVFCDDAVMEQVLIHATQERTKLFNLLFRELALAQSLFDSR
jgi:hypothetical protein